MNAYDIDNRLTNRAAIGYQASYAYNKLGWRTNMVDVSGTNSYQYDVLGELTNKMVNWAGGPAVSLNYRYDAIGPVTNLWTSSANGVTNAYVYDNLGRLTNVVAGSTMAATYRYDIVGNLQAIGYAAGVTNLYQYDALNRVTNAVWRAGNTALASFGYTLGPTGNRTNLAETVNGASRSYNWTYDSLYRLTGETIANAGTVNYAYDAVGNRTNRSSTITQLPANAPTYNSNDWLNSDVYDPNGNTTNSGTSSYQYDALNHLTNANNGAILIAYDADGNRAKKTVGSTTTYYLLDDRNPSGYVQVLEEWTVVGTSTNLAKAYNYGLDLISQRVPSISTNYFIYDGHGSTRILTDNTGNVANTFTYDAYGTLIASNTTAQTAYLYSGQQFDTDLGFYYNRARYLNVGTGRFWTMDTYQGFNQVPISLHKYLYGDANPVNMTDPSGRASTTAAQIGVAVHQYIGDDFIKKVTPGGVSGPSVVSILEDIPGFTLPTRLQGVVTAMFPDLTDVSTKQVYEM
jgi:RHS repeat-associated protein